MPAQSPNAYLRTKVLTASPAELRLMLIDGAIRFAEQGRDGLREKDYEKVYNGISRSQKIIMELINSLDHEADPELCQRLSGLYTFMYTRLIGASSEKDPSRVDEVLELLRYERETWTMLMEKLAEENADAARIRETPDAAPQPHGDTGADAEALVGGSVTLEA